MAPQPRCAPLLNVKCLGDLQRWDELLKEQRAAHLAGQPQAEQEDSDAPLSLCSSMAVKLAKRLMGVLSMATGVVDMGGRRCSAWRVGGRVGAWVEP